MNFIIIGLVILVWVDLHQEIDRLEALMEDKNEEEDFNY